MNIQMKFDELCYHIDTTDLSCDCIVDYVAVIKGWNLPYGEEILIDFCHEVADKVLKNYWNVYVDYSYCNMKKVIKHHKQLSLKKRGVIADLVGDGY